MTEDSTFLSTVAPRIAQQPGLTVNLEGLLASSRGRSHLVQAVLIFHHSFQVHGSAELTQIPGSHLVHLYCVKMFIRNSLVYK